MKQAGRRTINEGYRKRMKVAGSFMLTYFDYVQWFDLIEKVQMDCRQCRPTS